MATHQDKLNRILEVLQRNTGLSNLIPGSKAYQLAESIAYELKLLESDIEDISTRNSPRYATDSKLDQIGHNFFNVKRLGEVRPFITSSMKVIKFYTSIGVFGDLNKISTNGALPVPTDITIPEGTQISGFVDGIKYVFRVSKQAVLDKSKSEQFVNAELIQGDFSSLPSNTLTSHNFTSYTQGMNNLLKVTNVVPVSTGRLRESDENYRYRIVNSQNAFTKTTTVAIHRLLTEIPGVSDVSIEPATSGGGSFTVYVQGTTPVTGDEIIDKCKIAISQIVCPWQIAYNIVKPNYIGLEVSLNIAIKGTASFDALSNIIKVKMVDYINNLYTDKFYVNSLLSIAVMSHPDILDASFNYVRMYTGTEDTRKFEEIDLETNKNPIIILSKNEKLIAELLPNPVIVETL